VDITIGDLLDPLLLQVDGPGGSAAAFFQLNVNGDTLAAFHFTVDSTTRSAADALIIDAVSPLFAGNPLLDPFAELRSRLLSGLEFDAGLHRLRSTGPVHLYTVPVTSQTGPVTVEVIYGAMVSATAVPEPASVVGLGIAAAVIGFVRARAGRRGATWP
jgi:hypothetical protein